MRNHIAVVRWPFRRLCERSISTSAGVNQATEGSDLGHLSRPQSCPVKNHRARSTHAVASVFETLSPSVKPWEEVPGPKPLPLLGNTWRFIPYIASLCIPYVAEQRELSDKTLRCSLSAEFWNICVLSGRTQRRSLPHSDT